MFVNGLNKKHLFLSDGREHWGKHQERKWRYQETGCGHPDACCRCQWRQGPAGQNHRLWVECRPYQIQFCLVKWTGIASLHPLRICMPVHFSKENNQIHIWYKIAFKCRSWWRIFMLFLRLISYCQDLLSTSMWTFRQCILHLSLSLNLPDMFVNSFQSKTKIVNRNAPKWQNIWFNSFKLYKRQMKWKLALLESVVSLKDNFLPWNIIQVHVYTE